MRAAKMNKVDMFRYFEKVWDAADDPDHMYIGVHELCSLIVPEPCLPGEHHSCAAKVLLDTYDNIKVGTGGGAAFPGDGGARMSADCAPRRW